MTDDEWEACERCGRDAIEEDMRDISLHSDWHVCEGCVSALEKEAENRDWQDRYTEEQHEKATSLLSEQDEIQCVISDYDIGTIVVHTPYVSADAVVDFCRYFGFRIINFEPMWSMETEWPCVADHGDTFEITLKYLHDSPVPSLLDAKFERNRIDELSDSDKQF